MCPMIPEQHSPEACKQEILDSLQEWELDRLVLEAIPCSGISVAIATLMRRAYETFLARHQDEGLRPDDPRFALKTFRSDVLHAIGHLQRRLAERQSEYTLRFYEGDDCVQFEKRVAHIGENVASQVKEAIST